MVDSNMPDDGTSNNPYAPSAGNLSPEAEANYQSQDLVAHRQDVLDATQDNSPGKKKNDQLTPGQKMALQSGAGIASAGAQLQQTAAASAQQPSLFNTIFHNGEVQKPINGIGGITNPAPMTAAPTFNFNVPPPVQTPNMMQYSDKNLKTNIKNADRDIKSFLMSMIAKVK